MTDRQLPSWLAPGGAVAIGAMTAVQARVNGVLGVRIDDGILAGLISFAVGLVVLIGVVVALPAGRAATGRLVGGIRQRTIPFWMLLGGACGALTVTTQGLVAGVLGVSLFTVGVVAGQTLHGLLLDRIGFGPAGVVAVTPGRLLGGGFALTAVAVSLGGDVMMSAPGWLLVLPFLAGAGIAWQSGANGLLARRIASPLAATLTSFVAGTIVLVVAGAISVLVRGMPPALPAEPWLYLGGLLGFAYILLGAWIVAHTGVLLMGLGSLLGQLVTSVVIDVVWPVESGPVIWQLVAMVVVAVASVVVALPRRR